MINIDAWLKELGEIDIEGKDWREMQRQLFLEYVNRKENDREIRDELYMAYKRGEPLTGKNGLRKQLAAIDLAYFGRAYLSHYFKKKSPAFHEELDDVWKKGVLKGYNVCEDAHRIDEQEGTRNAIAAPRGHAKSTNFTFKDSLHAVLYRYKHYILIISDASEQAEGFLEDIRIELEENPDINEDFGEQKGEKAWRAGVLITKENIKIEAVGSGKKVRGRRHRNWRPDLIVLDDIENDENVATPEQRRKLLSWFEKAVSKAGDTYTDIMYIGTVLHYDSLLSNVMEKPKYKVKKYSAVISFATNKTLWEEWEKIYCNLFDENHEENAKIFYKAHEDAMLEGVEVLWEDKLPYYNLMEIRVNEGEPSFNSELQNDPVDPENAAFNPEWNDYYEPELMDFSSSEFIFIGANDPSLGKNNKSDTSGIVGLALSLHTGYMYVVDASIERRTPDVIIDDIFEIHRRHQRDEGKGFYLYGIETVQFQYFFKEVVARLSVEMGVYLPIEEMPSSVNKDLRIRSLQPFIKNRYIKFNREHKTLLQQLEEYPMCRNDDGPDALHMAVALAQTVKMSVGSTEYESVLRRALRFKEGAF